MPGCGSGGPGSNLGCDPYLTKAEQAINAEERKMSGQDEKWAIIDAAKDQYRSLMALLVKVSSSDPYSLLPAELEEAVRKYEKGCGVMASIDFRDALEQYWEQVKLPNKLMSKLEKIAKEEINVWG